MVKKEKQFWPLEGVTRSEVLKSQYDTKFNYLRTPKMRKSLVLSNCIMTLIVLFSSIVPSAYSKFVTYTGPLFLLAGYLLIRTSVRHIADTPDELLDERQIAIRDRSYLHSYRIISSLFALVIVALFIRIDLSETDFVIEDSSGTETWFALIMLMAGLPSMVLAWLDKNPEESFS